MEEVCTGQEAYGTEDGTWSNKEILMHFGKFT